MMARLFVRASNQATSNEGGLTYESETREPRYINLSDRSGTGVPYDSILDLGTAASPPAHLFVVGIELENGHEDDFEQWYNTEHLPALAEVPGVNRAVRYRRADSDGSADSEYPEYLALYDITAPDIAGNADWVKAVETPWTVRLRPHFRAIWRGGYSLMSE